MNRLTGRTRYRSGWFGRLILQVEVLDRRYREDGDLLWVDARAEDFATPHILAIFKPAPMPRPGQKPYIGRAAK